MTSTFRLAIATVFGICLGLILGLILFSSSQSVSISSNAESETLSNKKSDVFPTTSPKLQISPPIISAHQQSNYVAINNNNVVNIMADHHEQLFSISTFKPWNCESTFDVDEIRERYLLAKDDEIKSLLFSKDSLHLTVQHFRAVMTILKNEEFKKCWKKIRQNRMSQRNNNKNKNSFFFYDLGSRKLDQTQTFLQLYPGGRNYNIICFEPNPTFNAFYQKAGNPKIFHLNAAVGIALDTLKLSDRHVGSSIINEKNVNSKNNNDTSHSHIVKVLPFIESIIGKKYQDGNWKSNEITSKNNNLHHPLPSSFPDRVIVKMDVEKAEFAILHHLVRTGAISLMNELLLECHYNTNLPREKRDANIHIGYDDCVDLVDAIRDAGSDNSMEVVLWNSVKTATKTGRGYIERHGGFFPT